MLVVSTSPPPSSLSLCLALSVKRWNGSTVPLVHGEWVNAVQLEEGAAQVLLHLFSGVHLCAYESLEEKENRGEMYCNDSYLFFRRFFSSLRCANGINFHAQKKRTVDGYSYAEPLHLHAYYHCPFPFSFPVPPQSRDN